MPDAWNPEDLREFLEDHSVQGYEVTAPIIGAGIIESQERTGGGFSFFRVFADDPLPFIQFAQKMDISSEQLDLDQWKERFMYGSKGFPIMAVELRERLEEQGETVSQRDVLFSSLMETGCLDEDQKVVCYSFDSRDTPIRVLKRGLAVLVKDRETNQIGWPGRIVGFSKEGEGRYALVEQFAPIPFMAAPESMLPQQIKPGFYSSNVELLGYGILDAFEEQEKEKPAGTWSKDKKYYELAKTMPMKTIEKFCKAHYPDEPHRLFLIEFIEPVFCDFLGSGHGLQLPQTGISTPSTSAAM